MTTASTLVVTAQLILVGVIINIFYLEAVFVICRLGKDVLKQEKIL